MSEQKTHAEIIEEMNCGPIPEHRHDREILRLYAHELDAAHKRELDALDQRRTELDAASPRNCDKYPTFNDAIRALADKRGWHDAKWDSERYCILASWLYAPYEEGGAK